MRYSLGLILGIVVTGAASASSCHPSRIVYSHYTPSYPITYVDPVVKKVVEEFKITYFVPAILAFPGYGGSYVPPVVNAATPQASGNSSSSHTGELQQILTAIKQVDANVRSIDERVRVLEAKVNQSAAPLPPAAPTTPSKDTRPDPFAKPGTTGAVTQPKSWKTVFAARCAACHTDSVAATEGKGFVMFDKGNLVDFNDRQWRKIGVKLTTKQMPPEKDSKGNAVPEMPQDEFELVMSHMASIK